MMRILCYAFALLCCVPVLGQTNKLLNGRILYQNSGKQPAIGVKVSGEISEDNAANSTYSASNGSYQLVFPDGKEGELVQLAIGETDQTGQAIELVNTREVELCQIPADASEAFEIIVCPKGSRDLAAQRYYRILKSSSDAALGQAKEQLDSLLETEEKDYARITSLSNKIDQLESQADSLSIYKEALRIASINQDQATERVKEYLRLLEEGQSVQKAREALSMKKASSQLDQSVRGFKAAIEELELRAGASSSIFDYEDAIACYDTLIYHSERVGVRRLRIAEYHKNAGISSRKDGKFITALKYAEQAKTILEKVLPPNDMNLAIIYSNISSIYHSMDKHLLALKWQHQAIRIKENSSSIDSRSVASSHNSLGAIYQGLDSFNLALKHYQKALRFRERFPATNRLELAISYHNIAFTYVSLDSLVKATDYQKKAIQIIKSTSDPQHPDLGNAYNNLAFIYKHRNLFEEALKYQIKCLNIQKLILNSKHPAIANSFNNIGDYYRKLNKQSEAVDYQIKAIQIYEEIFRPNHPRLAGAYGNISQSLQELNQFKQALSFQEKSINILENLDPSPTLQLAIAYNNIASIYQNLNQDEEGVRYQAKSVRMLEEILPPGHENLGIVYSNLAKSYKDLNRFSAAIESQERALLIFQQVLSENHNYFKKAFNHWLEIYYKRGVHFFHLNDFHHAISDLDTVIIQAPKDCAFLLDAWYYKALCHHHLQDFPSAIQALQDIKSFPSDSQKKELTSYLGLAYAHNSQFPEAKAAFTEYEAIYPDAGITQRNWAVYHALQGEGQQARHHLQLAIERGYDDWEWIRQADCLKRIRKHKSIKTLIKAAQESTG